jgi:zinc transport system ATP-binding protein
MNADCVITCQNVSFGYGGHSVVRDLSCTVHRGDCFYIIGENGSGKTTLLKGMIGLIGPMQGTVFFNEEIKRSETGYLGQQDPGKKDFPAGVDEVVRSGMLSSMGLRPFYSRREKQKAEENMRLLGIAGLKNRCYRELSGGQQRRVLLARTFCTAGKLLALDEPMAGLDPLISEELYRLLKKINQETGVTIIMVSHDVKAAKEYASQIINLGKSLLD